MKSTANRMRSRGKRMTIELSEWFLPTYASSSTVPPSSSVSRSAKVTWGTAVGRRSPMMVALALSCATTMAVSVKTSPPAM